MISSIRFHCRQRLPPPSQEAILECLRQKGKDEKDEKDEAEAPATTMTMSEIASITTFDQALYHPVLRKCPKFVPLICPEWLHRFQVQSRHTCKAMKPSDTMIHIPDMDLFVQWLIYYMEEGVVSPSSSFCQTAILLGICTGRRMSEILGTGRFEVVSDHVLQFRGQVKKRARRGGGGAGGGRSDDGDSDMAYTVPVFFPATRLLAKIEWVQQQVMQTLGMTKKCTTSPQDDRIRNKIHQKFTGKLNRALHAEFDDELIEGTDYTFHDLRAIYAFLSYEFCCPRRAGSVACPMMPFPKWMTQVLGHAGATSSLHYNRVHVSSISDQVRDYFSHSMVSPSSSSPSPSGPPTREDASTPTSPPSSSTRARLAGAPSDDDDSSLVSSSALTEASARSMY